MSELTIPSTSGVTRRDALIGLGAVAGAAAAGTMLPFTANAGGSVPSVVPAQAEELVGAAIPGLTYLGIDAFAFLDDDGKRIHQTSTGSQPSGVIKRIWAPLTLPAGSVVYRMNVGYQGQPIAEISRRPITQPNPAVPPGQVFQKALQASPGGPFSSTENLATPVTIQADSTYTVASSAPRARRCSVARSATYRRRRVSFPSRARLERSIRVVASSSRRARSGSSTWVSRALARR